MGEDRDDTITDGVSAARRPGHIQFTEEYAYISMAPVPEVSGPTDGKYTFKPAWRQCLERLLAYPPSTFHTVLRGTNIAPHVDVVIKQSALHAIPLLSDIGQEALADNAVKGAQVPFQPPCSVWSLVSVLLLQEGDVSIDFWLGAEEHDVSLAAQALEVCLCGPTTTIKALQQHLTAFIVLSGNCVVTLAARAAVRMLASAFHCCHALLVSPARRVCHTPCERVQIERRMCATDGGLSAGDASLQCNPAVAQGAHRGVPQHWPLSQALAQQPGAPAPHLMYHLMLSGDLLLC